MADETQTPDLQAAGVPTPQETLSQPAVMQALQPRGPMPGNVMQALGSAPVSPGLGFGSGVLAAIGGHPGQNPYLQQQQQGQGQQMQMLNMLDQMAHRQQLEVQRQQELKERQQMHQLQRDDIARTVLKDQLFGPNAAQEEGVRGVLAKQYAQKLGGVGIEMPQSGVLAMSRGGPNQTNQKELAIKLAAVDNEQDPQQKAMLTQDAQRFFAQHGGKPEDWQSVNTTLRSDPYLESVNLPTKNKLRQQALDTQLKEFHLIKQQHPELADPKTAGDVAMLHRRLNNGKTYEQGDETSQQQAYNMAEYKRLATEEAKIHALEESRMRIQAAASANQDARQQAMFAQQQSTLEQKFAQQMAMLQERQALKGKTLAEEKRDAATAAAKSFLAQFKAIVPAMDKEGFLPSREDWFASKEAGLHRTIRPENDVLREWYELQANMIGWARTVQNDIGPRAMAAFQETNRIMAQPPTKAGLERIIKNMEAQLTASETGQPQPAPNNPGPLGAPRSVRAKDASGRAATIKLQPGEALPAGFTEIK